MTVKYACCKSLQVGLMAILVGCASGPEHAQDWRSATVVALGRAGELAKTVDHDCGVGASRDAPYLVVRYLDRGVLHNRTWLLGTTEIPSAAILQVGTAVQVNLPDCVVRTPPPA